jgi:hypothetical protein
VSSRSSTPLALLALVAFVLTACNTPPQNRGESGYRTDPTHDSPGELGSTDLRAPDLVTATDMMARDIAQRLDIVSAQSKPRIVVGKIENKTRMPHQNYQVFLARLRAQLQSSGAQQGLEFIAERARMEQARNTEYGGASQDSAASYASRADYMLTCEVYDLPSGYTNYYLLDYQLIQLRDAATGPDVGAGSIVWENSYEVKFQ